MRKHKGLSFGVRRVYQLYYSYELVGEEGGLDLSSLLPNELMNAQGVAIEELIKGVGKEAAKKLRYRVPDTKDHGVVSHFSLDALDMMAQNLDWSADYGGLSEEEQAKCDILAAGLFQSWLSIFGLKSASTPHFAVAQLCSLPG